MSVKYITKVRCIMIQSTLTAAIPSAYSLTPINRSTLPITPEICCHLLQQTHAPMHSLKLPFFNMKTFWIHTVVH